MLNEFRAFIARGNVVDLAVGVIIGGAFGKIVTSLVNDIVMPPIGLLLGRVDFSNLFLDLSGHHHASVAEAKAAGDATLNYGVFANTVIEFLILSIVVFLLVRLFMRIHHPTAVAKRACPYCKMEIADDATRCPHCTSNLAAPVAAATNG